MRYLMLICNDEKQVASLNESEGSAMLTEYQKFMDEMGKRGVL